MVYKHGLLIILAIVSLQGCVYVNDTGEERRSTRSRDLQPTIGQELLDLDRALETGVISSAEYDRIKARIINEI